MDELQKILKDLNYKIKKIEVIRKTISKGDLDKIRGYFKYNEELEDLIDSSFSVRSYLEDCLSEESLAECIEEIKNLEEGYEDFLGDE